MEDINDESIQKDGDIVVLCDLESIPTHNTQTDIDSNIELINNNSNSADNNNNTDNNNKSNISKNTSINNSNVGRIVNNNNNNNNDNNLIKYDNKCIFHDEHDYRFICSDCLVPVCDICIVSSDHHRSHVFDLINKTNTTTLFLDFKNKHFQNLEDCSESIKDSINDSNEIYKGLDEENSQNINIVTEEFKQLHSLLDSIEMEIVDRLKSHHEENKETNQKITITANDNIKKIDNLLNKYKDSINEYDIEEIVNNCTSNNFINGNSNCQHIELLKHSHQTQLLLKEQNNDNIINRLISEYNKITLADSIDHVKNSIKNTFQIQQTSVYSDDIKDPKRVKVGIDEFFIYKNGCTIPNGVVNLALGPSIKKLAVGSIPPTIKRLILLDGFKVQLTEGILPTSIKSLLVGVIQKPLIKGSIPTGVAYLFLLDGFDQEIVEIPRNVSEIFLYNTSFIVPMTYKGNLYKKPTYKQFCPNGQSWSGGGWEVKIEICSISSIKLLDDGKCINFQSNNYSTEKKSFSSNLKKLSRKPKIVNRVPSKRVSEMSKLLSKLTMEDPDGNDNDAPIIGDIDEEDEEDDFEFDSKLNFDITQDPLYRQHMLEEEMEKTREEERKKNRKEIQDNHLSYFDKQNKSNFNMDKRSIDEEMRLEYWASQMALRDSLKNDGGRYLMDEDAYAEPIKNYKILGRKLMQRHQIEKEKEKEEKKQIKEKLKYEKSKELGLSLDLLEQENEKNKLKSQEALKDLLTNEEFEQYKQSLQTNNNKKNENNNDDYDDHDEDEDDDDNFNSVGKNEGLLDEDIGLPNLSRLSPYTPVPPPIEIVQELLEIRKKELIKKTEQASDEFEKRRRIKRIEFIAKKKELQHKQMLERHKRMGLNESLITDEDDLPIEIDPKVFSRFQAGEITEQEMLDISKIENKQEREREASLISSLKKKVSNKERLKNEVIINGKEEQDNNDNNNEEVIIDEEDDEDYDDDDDDDDFMKSSRKNTEFLKHWKIGSIGIPPLLKKKITSTIKEYPTQQLRNDAALLSEQLRDRTRLGKSIGSPNIVVKPEDKPVITYGKGQVLAYISHRMPGVYACTHRVFSEINKRLPNFKPTSILDYGSGPGTVLWSADTIWGDSIKRIRAVEPSTYMSDIAKKLLEGNTNRVKWSPYLNTEQLRRGDGSIPSIEQNEMVTASYVLSELPSQEARNDLVRELWSHVKPSGILVLIEPGTPIGFNIIKEARQLILDEEPEIMSLYKSAKAQVVAPCPHSNKCPMGSLSWCHFSQRVERPVFQKLAKGPHSTMPFEDEKYSYIVLSKVLQSSIPNQLEKQFEIYPQDELEPTKSWSRLIEAPLKRGGHVIMDVCSPNGSLNRATIAKSHGKKIYKEARKSFWSDAFILDPEFINHYQGRFNLDDEVEIQLKQEEQEKLKELDNQKKKQHQQQQQLSKLSSISILEDLQSKEELSSIGIHQLSKKEKKEKEKENNKDWMNDLQGTDRKVLEKLIKQGKFSDNSSSDLFGTKGENNNNPASDYGTSEMELGFQEDEDDFLDEEEEQNRLKKKQKTFADLRETSKTRKLRKEKLQQDLNQLRKQVMSPEERRIQEEKEYEIKNRSKIYKENNPKRIEYYLKNFDKENDSSINQDSSELQRYQERIQIQQSMKDSFQNVKGGLSIASKNKEKLLKEKEKMEKYREYKSKKLQKKNNKNNNNTENVD
ncbi:hypothetical protein RB653_004007 [Dictyostelium firmibasis]|uniref:B box-type domain-containing protein n=1 Tax=Dictyostelium firmibasis TaxID=79012 RepID=A0AAN7U059_9MYCE